MSEEPFHPQLGPLGLGDALRSAAWRQQGTIANLVRNEHDDAVLLRALVEVLIAKGLVSLNELDRRRAMVDPSLTEERSAGYVLPTLHPTSTRGPAPTQSMNCAERHAECASACCSMFNVYLNAEEVQSGRFRWDLAEPYRLLRQPDGACVYLDRETRHCAIWDQRPAVCREYTCASDQRVWRDFPGHIVSEHVLSQRAREAGLRAQRRQGATTP